MRWVSHCHGIAVATVALSLNRRYADAEEFISLKPWTEITTWPLNRGQMCRMLEGETVQPLPQDLGDSGAQSEH
jgi:hypothetical protein